MYAGKTTHLLVLRGQYAKQFTEEAAVLLKSDIDTRYSPTTDAAGNGIKRAIICTHSHIRQNGYTVSKLMDLRETRMFLKGSFFFIDEGQFFPDLLEFCTLCRCVGKTCFIAGLNGDFNQKMFPSISDIMPLCSDTMYLHGTCMECGERPSSFTMLREDIDKPDGQVLVGGTAMYYTVCQLCLTAKKSVPTDRYTTPPPLYSNGSSLHPPTPSAPKKVFRGQVRPCTHDINYLAQVPTGMHSLAASPLRD